MRPRSSVRVWVYSGVRRRCRDTIYLTHCISAIVQSNLPSFFYSLIADSKTEFYCSQASCQCVTSNEYEIDEPAWRAHKRLFIQTHTNMMRLWKLKVDIRVNYSLLLFVPIGIPLARRQWTNAHARLPTKWPFPFKFMTNYVPFSLHLKSIILNYYYRTYAAKASDWETQQQQKNTCLAARVWSTIPLRQEIMSSHDTHNSFDAIEKFWLKKVVYATTTMVVVAVTPFDFAIGHANSNEILAKVFLYF